MHKHVLWLCVEFHVLEVLVCYIVCAINMPSQLKSIYMHTCNMCTYVHVQKVQCRRYASVYVYICTYTLCVLVCMHVYYLYVCSVCACVRVCVFLCGSIAKWLEH